jgi:pimeloyl-ACP methyl ester carboxylesterase
LGGGVAGIIGSGRCLTPPETRYALSGDTHIAYQVLGTGPVDLVLIHGWITHLDLMWEESSLEAFHRRLASFSRLILFDKRGIGLSDPVPVFALPTLEERMDDVRAVMDAAGSERAVLLSASEGGPMAALFAATYPQRVEALIIYGGYASRVWSPDYPWAPTPEQREGFFEMIRQGWGGVADLDVVAPSRLGDARLEEWWVRYLRSGASPAAALALAKMNTAADIRGILDAIRVPTLILHRPLDRDADIGGARYMAERIPGARLVELPGEDHLIWTQPDPILAEVEEFLTGVRPLEDAERLLATVVVTDIVSSTSKLAQMGDAPWRRLMDRHDKLANQEVVRQRGRVLHTTGDGVVAIFDGPARAVRAGCSLVRMARQLGVEVRVGVHTGEVELRADGSHGGMAVHIAARVAEQAGAGEVMTSRTVKDLVAGSGLQFAPRGVHTLKGLPDTWELLAVSCPPA